MAYPITVTASSLSCDLIFESLEAVEELGRPFEFRLRVLTTEPAIALDDILGHPVTIKAAFITGVTRYFHGEVAEFRQVSCEHLDKFAYEATLRPKLWFLSFTEDCRIFQNKSAKDIILEVLDEAGVTDRRMALSGTYNAREYCVQYNESDFAFISRLMEEEGIYYYFEHEDGKHNLVLADSISAHAVVQGVAGDGKIPYSRKKIGDAEYYIDEWVLQRAVRTVKYVHRNFHFETPTADLTSQSEISRQHASAAAEVFHYPGRHTVAADGTTEARTRIEELQAQFEFVRGKSNAEDFAAGMLFTLDGYEPREDQNAEHLLVRVTYDLQMEADTAAGDDAHVDGELSGVTFDVEFAAIPSATPFRTPSITPRPYIRGPQTAMVVGKSGEEIWTDQYGRVKLHFHWDRLGTLDENGSCWVRVAQVWSGKGFGFIQVPRIGEEVIVEFLEGNPDRPIIVGRVYNNTHMPPYVLPDNQTQSGVKSRSSKEGTADNFNELRFEDKKDSEQIYFHAEKNFDRIVENNDTLKVGFEKQDAGDQTIDIYNNRTVTLDQGNDKLQVKTGNRETLVDKGNDTHTIGEGNREVTISQGNDTLTITQGNLTIKIEAGEGTIEAATKLTLKVGDSSITIEPSKIELSSVDITLTATGNLEGSGTNSKVSGSASLDLDGGTISLN
jgi:type VI secretion system secreted protein VgrG